MVGFIHSLNTPIAQLVLRSVLTHFFLLANSIILSSDTGGAKRDLSLVSDSLRRLASFLEEAVVSISSIGLQFSH